MAADGEYLLVYKYGYKKRHEAIDLFKRYSLADYPEYDHYNASFVRTVSEIPCDTSRPLAVPITFLSSYSPEQFGIFDANEYRKSDDTPTKVHGLIKDSDATIAGKATYVRLLVRNKHPISGEKGEE